MNNYYRIKGYDPKHNFTFVLDSYGMFTVRWQFSSFIVKKGLKVLDIYDVTDTNEFPYVPKDEKNIFLRKTEVK